MKKYIQYSATQFAANPMETGSKSNSVTSEGRTDDCSGLVLDLSGKHGKVPVSLATNNKWSIEQDSALDLSSSSLQMVCCES